MRNLSPTSAPKSLFEIAFAALLAFALPVAAAPHGPGAASDSRSRNQETGRRGDRSGIDAERLYAALVRVQTTAVENARAAAQRSDANGKAPAPSSARMG